MRGLVVTLLVALAVLLQGCGKSAAPSTTGGTTSTTGGGTQHLYEGNCDLLASPFGGGLGSSNDPYLICTVAQLHKITEPGNGAFHYVQVKDLDLSGAALFAIADLTGSFDGNGYVLNHLQGTMLFANSSGAIRNVTVTGASIVGSFQAGVLLGWNQAGGVVQNCHVTGALVTSYSSGGLVGRNEGTITQSSANVALQGIDTLGGLVGLNRGIISKSRSAGSVVASSTAYGIVGGLVADNFSGTISDSYSTASAQGKSNVGGFFGQNEATIVNGFSSGAVAATGANLGGFGGLNTGTVTSSYFDSQTSGTGISSGGMAKTTLEMQSQGTYVGWDFATVWSLSSYPSLR